MLCWKIRKDLKEFVDLYKIGCYVLLENFIIWDSFLGALKALFNNSLGISEQMARMQHKIYLRNCLVSFQVVS